MDSHVVLWWMVDEPSLGPRCRRAIEEADEAFYSAVTPWELGIEQAAGKLALPGDAIEQIEDAGFQPLPITPADGERAASLPPLHRDPFDRMLVAQAYAGRLTLVTADRGLWDYDIDVLDARR